MNSLIYIIFLMLLYALSHYIGLLRVVNRLQNGAVELPMLGGVVCNRLSLTGRSASHF
jgi:hypothetical protein